MGRPIHKATHQQMREWAVRLTVIEGELHRANMHVTARAVNKAVKAIGWEFAGEVETAGKAAKQEIGP